MILRDTREVKKTRVVFNITVVSNDSKLQTVSETERRI